MCFIFWDRLVNQPDSLDRDYHHLNPNHRES